MRIFLVLMLMISLNGLFAQNENHTVMGDPNRASTWIFDQNAFNGRFAVKDHSDDSYDYYVVDLQSLPERFEKVYFMVLTYDDRRIVNLEGNIDRGQTWFKAYYTNTENDIICLFNDLKDKTQQASETLTAEEKSAWLAKNDKFKKN